MCRELKNLSRSFAIIGIVVTCDESTEKSDVTQESDEVTTVEKFMIDLLESCIALQFFDKVMREMLKWRCTQCRRRESKGF